MLTSHMFEQILKLSETDEGVRDLLDQLEVLCILHDLPELELEPEPNIVWASMINDPGPF
ncbi:MAG TPA: hypothetical protein VFM18_18445 [Methanosarcina sp.]|nr:hypothetical protein [Methanosarcina sp.]